MTQDELNQKMINLFKAIAIDVSAPSRKVIEDYLDELEKELPVKKTDDKREELDLMPY